jgi:diguanylate cyclase (GGDEF)-like protein
MSGMKLVRQNLILRTVRLGVLMLLLWIPAHAQDDIAAALEAARQLKDTAPAELLQRSTQILEQVDPDTHPGWAMEALDLAISAAIDLGQLEEAEQWAQQRLVLAQSHGNAETVASSLQDLAAVDMAANQYPQAKAHLKTAIELVEPAGDSSRLASLYNTLGKVFRYQSRYESALDYYQRAMKIYEAEENLEGIGSQFNSIGVVLELMGDYEGSLDALGQSLAISRQTNDVTGVASSLYNIGEIYRELEDFQQALQYFEDSLEMDLATGNPGDIAYSRNMIGQTLTQLGRYDEARTQITQSMALFKQIKAPRDEAWAQCMLGRVELEAGNLGLARRLLEEALATALERDSRSLAPIVRVALVELELKEGNSSSARRHVEAGLAQSVANEEKEKQEEYYRLLTQVFEAEENYQGAVDALHRRIELREEIFRQDRTEAIARMQSQVESVRRETEIDRLRLEAQLQEAELARQRWVRNSTIVGMSVGFLVLILIYGRFSQKRLNRRLSLVVADRTRKLTEAYQELEDVSLTDQLTGLRNRRFLDLNIGRDLAATKASYQAWLEGDSVEPVDADLVLFLLDLDHFKPINDRHGHATGDAVLEQIRPLLLEVFRGSDHMVRWGGEEFLVVARNTDRKRAHELAERVRMQMKQHRIEAAGVNLELTCSIGYAAFPFFRSAPDQVSWGEVLEIADRCLYAAKASGRDAWVGCEGLEQVLAADIAVADRFEALVRAGKLPIRTSLGSEAALCWTDADNAAARLA